MGNFESMEAFYGMFSSLLRGLGVTASLFGWTLLFAIPLGLIICMGRMSKIKPIKWIAQLYIVIFRGTPLLLQLIFFFFGIPVIFGVGLDRFVAAVLGFSLNYAAYFAEIYRGGIQSIPKGQYEAAQVLGLSRSQCFFKIVLPQVFKRIIPPLGNETVTLVKDTSLLYGISITELLREAQIILMRIGDLTPLIVAGVFYLIMTTIVTFIFNRIEKKLNYYSI